MTSHEIRQKVLTLIISCLQSMQASSEENIAHEAKLISDEVILLAESLGFKC